jgi:hypothetical protein
MTDKQAAPLESGARAFTRMPQELWAIVLEDLPSLTGKYAADAFGFALEPRHQRHSSIWDLILKPDEDWTPLAVEMGLLPFLVGSDLYKVEEGSTEPAFLVLLTGTETGSIRQYRDKLLSSLRPHDLENGEEIVFKNSNIVLNVVDALYNTFFTTLDPRRLFSYEEGELRSACLYWKDSDYALRPVGCSDIVGIGGLTPTLESVSYICGITFKAPDNISGPCYQKCFVHQKCPPAYPIYPSGSTYRRNNTLGWQWGDDHIVGQIDGMPRISSEELLDPSLT